MHFSPKSLATGLLLLALPCGAFARTHHSSKHSASVRHTAAKGKTHHGAAVATHHEVAAMDADRATAIQSALIRQGYMSGEPTGHWDADSVAAMQKMQSDNGWQTKVTPDSRALIKLGLGPGQSAPQPLASTY